MTTTPTIGAAAQRQQIATVLHSIELEMTDASGDPQRFAELRTRRERLRAEDVRLAYAERREQAESEQADREALRERLNDARARAAEAHLEIELLAGQMAAAIENIATNAARLAALGRALEKLARSEDVALTALAKAGIAVAEPRPTISPGGVPREPALTLFAAAHAVLKLARIEPTSPAASTARQHFTLPKGA